ncbi:MAG: hypothetical protein AB7G17_10190 [Phycisphaerales bacterium]
MGFATDRDLLVLEPGLFREVGWSAQRVVEASGVSVSGTTLTSAGSDFVTAGVTAGHVALVNGAVMEVVARLSATQLTVSRVREEAGGVAIPPGTMSGATLVVMTFRAQLSVAHGQVLRMLGIEPGSVGQLGEVGETSIVNPGSLARVEALGAMHAILSSASAMVGETSATWAKAEAYRERFREERQRVAALIDLNGDGVADATRRMSVTRLTRA